MKLLNNKYLVYIAVGLVGMFTSCSDDNEYAPGDATAAGCAALTFGENNVLSEELDPNDPTTATITVYRSNSDAQATYPLSVLSNTDNIFSVPQSVSFAAGAKEAEFEISFNGAEVGESYSVEIALDDADVDAYSADTYKSFVYTCVRVKWNTVGTGQWLDGFWYGFWSEVDIQERDDKPGTYRINNPYTDELVSSYGEAKGTYTDHLVFTLSKQGLVSWTTPIYINTLYGGSVDIKGYFPSTLSSSQAALDELSVANTDDAGNILYFTIAPYWYVDGAGGWGTDYPCYLAFPGVDLATEFGYNE